MAISMFEFQYVKLLEARRARARAKDPSSTEPPEPFSPLFSQQNRVDLALLRAEQEEGLDSPS